MQFFVNYPLLRVEGSANLLLLQAAMRKIATFELIDGDIVKEYIWFFDEEEDLDFFLEVCGIDSHVFMFTLGLPLYIFVTNLIILVSILLSTYKAELLLEGGEEEYNELPMRRRTMGKCTRWKKQLLARYCDKQEMKQKFMFNFFMTFFYEAQLEICISIGLNLLHFHGEGAVYSFGRVLTVIFLVLEVIFILFVLWLFFCKRPNDPVERL